MKLLKLLCPKWSNKICVFAQCGTADDSLVDDDYTMEGTYPLQGDDMETQFSESRFIEENLPPIRRVQSSDNMYDEFSDLSLSPRSNISSNQVFAWQRCKWRSMKGLAAQRMDPFHMARISHDLNYRIFNEHQEWTLNISYVKQQQKKREMYDKKVVLEQIRQLFMMKDPILY